MTRDLTDQKGWVSSKVIRWYRYSLPYLYNFMLFHDISLKNEIFYQSVALFTKILTIFRKILT